MPISTTNVLDILRAYGIVPEEGLSAFDHPSNDQPEVPGIGEIAEGETVYATSLNAVFSDEDGELISDDPRIREWWNDLQGVIDTVKAEGPRIWRRLSPQEATEPHCAWYCPIHFYGHGWGIYVRESCILSTTLALAACINWRAVRASPPSIARQLLRSAFYTYFLHEQFHHKVESLGFRLLISTGSDRYRPYKANVYRRHYLTSDCLEESLANAESYRRLSEARYVQRIDPPIREGLRRYLKLSIPMQPPGYAEGIKFFSESDYRDGLYLIQSQILDGALVPATPTTRWSVAPNMITALADISDEIYVVLPVGARPLFRPTSVDPGATASTAQLVGALTRFYGYQQVSGGKGSHVKLKKPGGQTLIIPGNRPVLSPGIIKHVLDAFGHYPISRLPEFLAGRLVGAVR